MSNKTSATVVADTVSPYGKRLTTLEVTMHPRAVEHFLTHRAFSRNGASRRAIPLRRQIEDVASDDCFPAKFGAEQRGMQSGDEVTDDDLVQARRAWRVAKVHAVVAAKRMGAAGVHKEVASAPMHPFMWRTYLVSATEWDGFMRQRLSPKAQADIRLLAQCIDQAMSNSTPGRPVDIGLLDGGWHLPYIEEVDLDACDRSGEDPRMVSAMRCARVSYLSHPVMDERGDVVQESKRDVQEDAAKGMSLANDGHWSPFEHVATPADPVNPDEWRSTANFVGWSQLRTKLGA